MNNKSKRIGTSTYLALREAYITLLQMPHNMLRHNSQSVLCQCRDALADEMHMDEEEVQNKFEQLAAERNAALIEVQP